MTGAAVLEAARDDVDTDDELTALAMASDPDMTVPDDAVCLWDLVDFGRETTLPEWYMPTPLGAPRRSGWKRVVALVVVVAFLAIDAYGLCSTYGQIVLA